jgi:hypothetical protein
MEINFNNLIKESYIITEGRVEDARERYPNIPEPVFNTFVELDPSGNQKYLMSLCKLWDEEYSGWGYRYRNKSLAKDFMENVEYFHNQTQKFEKKDINQYRTFDEFKEAVADAKERLTKGEIKKSSKKIYEDGTHLVIQPTTHAASCYYGSGTRWCTTMRDTSQYFRDYTSKGTLFYYINKKNGKKRALYTSFKDSFLTPEVVAGTRQDRLARTQVYTEKDNRGRSLTGIPVQARIAMNDEHKKSSKKYVDSLTGSEKIKTMIKLGFDLPENTVFEGDWGWTMHMPIPDQIVKIDGNVDTHYLGGVNTLNNVVEITGDLLDGSNRLEDLGKLERLGGDYIARRRWGSGNVPSLNNLKYVGGTLDMRNFIDDIDLDELKQLEHVGYLILHQEQFDKLFSEIEIPNIPKGTKITI